MSGILLVAAAAAAFNLNCTGQREAISELGTNSEAFVHNLRIDTEQRKWCEGECKRQFDIQEVRPDIIIMKRKTEQTSLSFDTTDWSIDRQSGSYSFFYQAKGRAGITVTKKGTCEPEEFTGFPQVDTKF